ncbi:peptide chain release factor H [Desulfosporosinus meridiei]|uniref:Putative peptide chain release factor H n=1 Tax=Desulfosporosinus meridiei (strain ATCC BAA-275 / DSM 13257 / KCTC 12902 / NCIMB 13706 / S10) TaxID=768704 RepID=J7J085_DESMD|nr:peptide chain release factor H [Desulfosporosinus meridiei]AFQ44351.1 putative peptide chain release factor H [Desulfosporosinus meridiei DSM 13257]
MWMQISSGKGPEECELAVGHFLQTILKENKTSRVIDAVPGRYNGTYKSVLLSIDPDEYKGDSGNTKGTILWICQSPYRPNHRRKNWFINIEVYQSAERLNFTEYDVKIVALRRTGPGGQNVNKVETAVRAVHIPTGLTVTASEERSQYMNKKLALARLANLIETKNEDNNSNHKESMWRQHNLLTRGNPMRIYEGKEFKLKQ